MPTAPPKITPARGTCQLEWCDSHRGPDSRRKLVQVLPHVDGAAVGICHTCARALSIQSGEKLPNDHRIRYAIGARMTREAVHEFEMEVGRRIRTCKEAAGIDDAELQKRLAARQIKVSTTALREWQNGRKTMRLGMVPHVAAVLDITIAHLLGEEE